MEELSMKEGLIIGGQDTCQGDSGGPLWVEEDGRVSTSSIIVVYYSSIIGHIYVLFVL